MSRGASRNAAVSPVHRAVALAGAIEQRAKARDAIKLPQPEGDDGAVAPAKRHHVRHRGHGGQRQTLLIRPFRVERARELEGDARAAQARLGRGQAGPRLRHDRAGVRQLCAGQVMVGDDQVHAERAARARLLERIDAGIHRHNKAHAFAGDVAQGRLVQAVSLAVARGQVIDRVRTGGAQAVDEDGRGAHAVGIVIAVDADALAAADGRAQTLHGGRHVRQRQRVRQAVRRGMQERVDGGVVRQSAAHKRARKKRRHAVRGGDARQLRRVIPIGMGAGAKRPHGASALRAARSVSAMPMAHSVRLRSMRQPSS